ncbi:uncharacterized protein ACA1_264720 [Acanthamoeba castellanii str. Neff]|uniref:Uncharacterized protein n=1 Tax=Acanthamoeba castellanii (strain ATCC 30010 / Neff) TaxID=1257118 RepID=L8H3J8_ACACF|nr:uncharacterized protein ACA1_264720 [Acanthamoeba castellanii str. Neff]ELR19298.1 hypothetical protein ACA1_264720 [Acanthamoeba castellanii str. Neff]
MKFAGIIALFALLLIAQVSSFQFALQMKGYCTQGCQLKGGSQTVTTTISSSDDAVKFSVASVIGTYATFNISDPSTGFSKGDMSFGTHLARTHTVEFEAFNPATQIPGAEGMVVVNDVYNVKGGSGAFDGATGMISATASVNTTSGYSETFVYGVIFPKAH